MNIKDVPFSLLLAQVTYTYDALGRQIGVDTNSTQRWTVYNGSSADANPYADFNGSGSVTTRYLYGLAVDQIIARTSSSGVTAWYMTDQLGSVRDVVSTSGTVLDHIVYGSFGNIISQTNSSNGDRFMFTGMEYDATTGIYYDHARYYDPTTGRFVSQDPKGFAAGDTNDYRYVKNSPGSLGDPTGLCPGCCCGGGGQAGTPPVLQGYNNQAIASPEGRPANGINSHTVTVAAQPKPLWWVQTTIRCWALLVTWDRVYYVCAGICGHLTPRGWENRWVDGIVSVFGRGGAGLTFTTDCSIFDHPNGHPADAPAVA